MNRFVITLVCGLIGIASAHAALNDTQEQIERRYGKPTNVEKVVPPATYVAVYEQGEVKIRVAYMNGRAQHIRYFGFEKADVDAVLKANQIGAQPWVKFSSVKGAPKPRLGGSSGCWICPGLNAEAHAGYSSKKKKKQGAAGKYIEFATDEWLKAKASKF